MIKLEISEIAIIIIVFIIKLSVKVVKTNSNEPEIWYCWQFLNQSINAKAIVYWSWKMGTDIVDLMKYENTENKH